MLVGLLSDRALRAAVIPLLGTASDAPTAAAGLIANFAALNAADPGTFYTPGAKGYTDYPEMAA